MNAAILSTFAEENLNAEIATRQQEAAESVNQRALYDFDESLPASFLPHIIALAEGAGIRLIFVRLKQRRHALGKQDSKVLAAYVADLRAYLDAHCIPLVDFTRDERITIHHFGNGDHLNRQRGRRLFTEILAGELKPLMK